MVLFLCVSYLYKKEGKKKSSKEERQEEREEERQGEGRKGAERIGDKKIQYFITSLIFCLLELSHLSYKSVFLVNTRF